MDCLAKTYAGKWGCAAGRAWHLGKDSNVPVPQGKGPVPDSLALPLSAVTLGCGRGQWRTFTRNLCANRVCGHHSVIIFFAATGVIKHVPVIQIIRGELGSPLLPMGVKGLHPQTSSFTFLCSLFVGQAQLGRGSGPSGCCEGRRIECVKTFLKVSQREGRILWIATVCEGRPRTSLWQGNGSVWC